MADTLQDGLTQFRDILYSIDPETMKSFPGFKFNRDEFIFLLEDKKTMIVSCSDKKFSVRVGKISLMNFIDNGGTWDLLKYDDTVYDPADDEMVWMKATIDRFLDFFSVFTYKDDNKSEYDNLLLRISNNEV